MKPWVKWSLIGFAGVVALGTVIDATKSPEEKAAEEAQKVAAAQKMEDDRKAEESAQAQRKAEKDAAAREELKRALASLPKYSSRDIAADYEANTVAADMKYKGKEFKVTGKITEISTDITGDPYIVLNGVNMFLGPRLHFSKDYLQAISTAKKGMSITVYCEGAGDVLKAPMLHECRFLPPDMRG